MLEGQLGPRRETDGGQEMLHPRISGEGAAVLFLGMGEQLGLQTATNVLKADRQLEVGARVCGFGFTSPTIACHLVIVGLWWAPAQTT